MVEDIGLRLFERRAEIAHAQLTISPSTNKMSSLVSSERFLNSCDAMIFIKFNEALKLCCLKIRINAYGKVYVYSLSRLFVSPNQLTRSAAQNEKYLVAYFT
ncbi:hypothetical protein CBW55_02365 [Yersinia intermedia]|nr:hypothetical protein CBW55_02365 [Yersinia intermedia]